MKLAGARHLAVLGVALAAPAVSASAGDPQPATLCQAAEHTVFTCQLAAKIVSICNLPGQAGATYRYGAPGHQELALTGLHRAYRGWSGGGETQATAATPAATYVVYDQMISAGFDAEGHALPQITQGLLVQTGGRTLSSQVCASGPGRTSAALSLMELAKLVPEGAFIDH